jgi:hypothetical protein
VISTFSPDAVLFWKAAELAGTKGFPQFLKEASMLSISPQLKWSRLLAVFVAGLFCVAPAWSAALAQNSRAGRVVGNIDGIRLEGDQYFVVGWACQQGNKDSIYVHLYADHSALGTPAWTFVTVDKAELDSEPAVNQRCQDAKGGKHRFKIELPNQVLKTFQGRKLYAHGIAVIGNVENAAIGGSGTMAFPKPAWDAEPKAPDGHTAADVLDGPRVVVFDTAKDSCELIDVPDAMARAFRDDKGTVHLIASHYVTRASLGPTLESAKHNCQVAYNSHHDSNPADFDDNTWLDSFYSLDGRKIVALGHMEYHGDDHPGMCLPKDKAGSCWHYAATFHMSQDGGYHFESPKAPANYVLGPPYKYDVNQPRDGYGVDTNIVKVGGWYYAMVSGFAWPTNCGEGKDAPPCLVPGGASPIRTSNILDPSSWRGWDGIDFNVVFADPYRGPVVRPQDHIFRPVPYLHGLNGLNFHEPSHLFIATLWDPWDTIYGPRGLYFSTSTDLIHWSKPTLAITLNQFLKDEPEGNWSYAYFSLIDPKSTDSNYSMVTDNPYLYYVRMDENHGPYTRVLFRQRIKLNWRSPVSSGTPVQNSGAFSGAGPVIGHIDGIRPEGDQYYVSGWACQQGNKDSINVHIYADHSAYDTLVGGTFVLSDKADLESGPAVSQACRDQEGSKHRFKIALPNEVLKTYQGKKLYVHGIGIVGDVENSAIDGSGTVPFPKPPIAHNSH